MDKEQARENFCKTKSCEKCPVKKEVEVLRVELLQARMVIGQIALKNIENTPKMWVNED